MFGNLKRQLNELANAMCIAMELVVRAELTEHIKQAGDAKLLDRIIKDGGCDSSDLGIASAWEEYNSALTNCYALFPNYIRAVQVLEKYRGIVPTAGEVLDKVYKYCPALKEVQKNNGSEDS